MSNNVTFVFNATDNLSRRLQSISDEAEALRNNVNSLNPEVSSLSERFAAFRENLTTIGGGIRDVGEELKTSLTLPIVLAGAFMVKAASDAEEVNQKFGVVFKSVSVEATKASADLASGFGLSKTAASEFLAGTGDLLTGLGFSGKAALDMSVKANQLAVDLASFTNVEGGAKRAADAMTSALLGEREALVALGIKVSEDMVNRKVAILLNKGHRFETLLQAKAAATLAIATEQSKNAIGDFSRSQGSLANQTRIARAKISDMSVEIGKILLPFALKLVKLISKLTDKFSDLSPKAKRFGVALAAITASLPILLILIGSLVIAFGAVTLPITLTVLAIGALVAAGIFLAFNWEKVKKKVIESFKSIKDSIALVAKIILFKFGTIVGELFRFLGVNDEVRTKVVDTFNTVSTAISNAIDFSIKKVKEFINFATPSFKKVGDLISEAFSSSIGFVSGNFASLAPAKQASIAPLLPTSADTTISQAFQMGFQGQKSTTDVNIKLNAPKGTVDKIDSKTRGSIDGLNLGLNMQTGTGG